MKKQDMQGVRSPTDIERKYDLGSLARQTKAQKMSEQTINRVEQTLQDFVNATGKNFQELQQEIEENITYTVQIDSTNGLVFKNGDVESVLSVRVMKGNEDITSQFTDTQFCWTRVSKDTEGDLAWNETHKYTKSVKITSDDVYVKAIFNVILNL